MNDHKRTPNHARDRMMGEIAEGAHDVGSLDHSTKSILARGCDPQMAIRASSMLPPQLGNPTLVSTTNDDDFIAKLKNARWSVVFFAPGACRHHAANNPIPGARTQTQGWSLTQYRDLVRQHQGDDVQIVETTEEREIISLLRRALAQSRDAGPSVPNTD